MKMHIKEFWQIFKRVARQEIPERKSRLLSFLYMCLVWNGALIIVFAPMTNLMIIYKFGLSLLGAAVMALGALLIFEERKAQSKTDEQV